MGAIETLLSGAVQHSVPPNPKRPGVGPAKPHLLTFRLGVKQEDAWERHLVNSQVWRKYAGFDLRRRLR